MPILDAALAFALTMLVVASVGTQIVRLLQNLFRSRVKIMQQMLADYFDREIKPVVDRELKRLSKRIDAAAAAEIKKLADELDVTQAYPPDELANLVHVSTEDIAERLKRSELGMSLLQEIGDDAQAIFDQLGRQYEIIGARFTASFREKARWWSTGVAFLLAVVFNIDTVFILDSYLRKPELRESVIAQLDDVMNDIEAKIPEDRVAASPSAEQLKQSLAAARTQVESLTQAGLPLGWSYYPHSYLLGQCGSDCNTRADPLGLLTWLIGIFLTTFCAGLGSPFWFDMIRGISRITQRAGYSKA